MTTKKKLTSGQIYVIETLAKHNCMIMYDNWVTGGHGIRLNGRSIEALKKMNIIDRGELTDLGKRIANELKQ